VPIVLFPEDSTAVPDSPRLTLVLMEPDTEWSGGGIIRKQVANWIRQRGESPRFYPASLVWCFKKPGREFREKVELWLAWRKVAKEIADGTSGSDYDKADRAEISADVRGSRGGCEG